VSDWGGLRHATVAVARPDSEQALCALVAQAAEAEQKLSLRGAGHSGGGHSFVEGGLMLDLRGLDGILELDEAAKTIRVQAGASWGQLTEVLEPLRLGLPTKQEFECFRVGVSIAANAHGKSIDHGPLIGCVRSLRLLKADGSVVTLSREQEPELFSGVVGGYGLLGIVLDATFGLIDDRPVEKTELVRLDAGPLIASYIERVQRDPAATPLCYGFLDPGCERGFYVTYTYADPAREYTLDQLRRHDPSPRAFGALAWLERRSAFLRRRAIDLTWLTSRGSERTLRSRRLLLWDYPPKAMEGTCLQKYFVPVERFADFVREAGEILSAEPDLHLMTPHFRLLPGSGEPFLSFSENDTICLILSHLARPTDPPWVARFERTTSLLLDACLDAGGGYFPTFDTVATREQLVRGFPAWDDFCELKRRHDADEIFTSSFYEKYARA